MDDEREVVSLATVDTSIGSPGDVLTYLGPNFVPRFRPVTGAGLGNVTGPATTTVDFVPQWNNTTGTLLKNGLPVSITGAASSLVETDAGGKIAASVIPTTGVTPGTYASANITVLADGRLSAASPGAAAGIGDAPVGPTVYGRNTGAWLPVVPVTGTTMTGQLLLPVPTGPTSAVTKGYVDTAVSGLAPLVSPNFTGVPTAPNQVSTDDSTRLATTHFVKSQGYTGTNQPISLTGDVVGGPGTTSIPTTIANTVSPATVSGITFNNRGLVTAATDQGYVTASSGAFVPSAGGTISGMAPGTLTINRSPSLPAAPAAVIPLLWAISNTTEPASIVVDAINTATSFMVRRANGTAAAPTRLNSGDGFGQLAWRGYFGPTAANPTSAAGYGPTIARIEATALEDFDATHQGTGLALRTALPGSASLTTQMSVGPGVTVGTSVAPTGGIQFGDLNGVRLFQNGQPIVTSAALSSTLAGYVPTAGGVISGTAPGTLTINRNAAMPAMPAGATLPLWIVAADSDVNPLFGMDAFNVPLGMLLRRANGTAASPTRVVVGDYLGNLAWRGYADTHYGLTSARIIAEALEDFHDTAVGTTLRFETTAAGQIAPALQVKIGPGLTVGMPTPPAGGMQIGDGNFSRVLLNGLPVTGGASGPITLSGDVTGTGTTSIAATVERIRGHKISTIDPTNTQVLAWNEASSQWEPTPPSIGASTGTVASGTAGQITWYASSGTTVSGNPTVTTTAAGALVINRGVTLPPAPAAITPVIWMVSNTTENTSVVIDSFGVTTSWMQRRANGTAAAPSRLSNGDGIGQIAWRGYYGPTTAVPASPADYTTTVARIQTVALEDFDNAHQGTQVGIHTVPLGSATIGVIPVATFRSGVIVGAATGGTLGDTGVGTINVAGGYYVNGALLTAGGGGITQLTGDVLAGPGSGSVAATINNTVTAGNAQGITYNARGLITAAVNQNYATTAALAGYLPLVGGTISGTAPGSLTINRGATMPPAPASITPVIWMISNTAENTSVVINSFGITTSWLQRRANGTAAAPTRLSNADGIGQIAWRGYYGPTTAVPASPADYTATTARIQSIALEDFDNAHQATQLQVQTVPRGGSTTIATVASFRSGLVVGSPSGGTYSDGDMGAGTVNATGLFINGTAVGTASATVNPGTGPQIAQYPAGTSSVVGGVPMTGDVTIAQGGATTIGALRVATGMLQDASVTLAKMENRTAGVLIGRGNTTTGVPQEVTLGSGLSMSGTVLTATGGATGLSGMTAGQIPIPNSATTINASGNLSGDVTTANSLVTTIGALRVATGMLQANAVTYAKMQTVAAANRLLGNPTGTPNSPVAEIILGTNLAFAGGTTLNVSGFVTSVGMTVPAASLFAVTPASITTTGTFAVTTTGTSGGVAYFDTVNTLNSSGLLAAGRVVLGGGAGAAPTSLAAGTTTTVLHGNATAGVAPAWGPVSLTTDVGGVLQAAQAPAFTGGDVTSTAGSLALTIQPNVVTYAKMQAMTANRLLGSGLSGTAVAEVILGTNLSFTGMTLNAATGGGGGVGTSVINRVPYYDTTTTVAGNPAITSTTAGSLMINRNAAAAPGVFTATTALQVNFADNDVGGIELDTHGAVSPTFVMRHAKGTGAQAIAPNAACQTLAADVLGLYQWRGYEATTPGYSAGVARMQAVAIDSFTSTVRGTQIEFAVAPVGGTALTTQATIATGVLIGAPTAAATPAVGDLNCQRLLVQGLPVTAFGTPSLSWIVGASPNGAVLFVADRACTVATARAVIVTTGNAGSTLTLKKNNTTTLNSTAFALDGATGAATITLTTPASLVAGDYINITTAGTVTTGAGNVTVYVS